jgi:hypothetical protein
MAKLHELLAAEGTVKTQADKCRSDLLNTFEKKRHLFGEKVVTFQPNAEGAPAVTEDQSDLQSTVKTELKWIADIWAKALDAAYQIAESNMNARADVVLDNGETIMRNVPATALLELEKRAGEIHALVTAIPTLDPAKGFKPDADRGDGVSRAREITKTRTKKTVRPIVKYEATKEHPAQVELIQEDIPIGTIREQEWSGLITPGEKADMLTRAEELRRALKTARSRANEAAAATEKIGLPLLQYVFGG